MLDLKRLRVLSEVARQGSFSAAADTLYLSQSAVSQQVATLEKEVGLDLLERTTNGPKLTDAGQVLVTHADAAIARLEEAEHEVAAIAGLEGGELRIASFPDRQRRPPDRCAVRVPLDASERRVESDGGRARGVASASARGRDRPRDRVRLLDAARGRR